MSTADTTLLAEVTAIMTDLEVDVPGVATAFGRRAVAQHNSPPMVGWWPATEAPGGARKNAFPGGRRELYSSAMALTVRCWGVAATPLHTYAASDLEATMALREAVIACIHRRLPGAYQWPRAVWVETPSQSDLGEMVDLTITISLGILDRAPTRAAITSAAPPSTAILDPGESL